MKTILVPIDFSEVTGKVVDTASSLAAAFGSRVILIHVDEPESQFAGFDPGPLSAPVVIADLLAGQRRLEAFNEKFGTAEVLAVHVQGSIPEEILTLARKHGATLIVMGFHGHGALHHLLVGSITSAILKHAPCPILIVPSDRHLPGTE